MDSVNDCLRDFVGKRAAGGLRSIRATCYFLMALIPKSSRLPRGSYQHSFSDELFPALGVLILGFEYYTPKRDVQIRKAQDTGLGISTRWSLAISHLRYYGSAVQVRSDENQCERASVDEMWLTCLGVILRQWEVSVSNLEASIQWF